MTDPYHVIEDLCATLENVRHLVDEKEQREIDGQVKTAKDMLADKGFDNPYVIVPANMEVIGPFESMEDAASFADNYYAGQVNCCIRTLMKPEEE